MSYNFDAMIWKFDTYLGAILGLICCSVIAANGQDQQPKFNDDDQHYFSSLLDAFHERQQSTVKIVDSKKNYSIMLQDSEQESKHPFFCRMENKINEGNKLKCLFRLGSASYVNYLEQKGDRQRLMLEQLRHP